MTVDDYVRDAGDPNGPRVSIAYRIAAEAHPDVLLRVAAVVNLANQAPWSVTLGSVGAEEVLIEVVLRDIPKVLAEMIQRKLTQLTCVVRVEKWPWP